MTLKKMVEIKTEMVIGTLYKMPRLPKLVFTNDSRYFTSRMQQITSGTVFKMQGTLIQSKDFGTLFKLF